MIRIATFCCLALICTSAAAAPIKVFILTGQSNAGGGMAGSAAPAPLDLPQNNLLQYRVDSAESANWIPMAPQQYLGGAGGGWGTELSFAKTMEQRTGSPVAIIKVAFGGTTLWRDFLPSANDLYPVMMAKVNSSLGQLQTLGYQPDVSGVIWIQGEGDANILEKSQQYDDNLALLAGAMRTDLSKPNLPFLINELHVNLHRPLNTTGPFPTDTVLALRQSQRNAVASDPNMGIVNFDDLPLGPDFVHWVSATHLELGRRFADLLLPSGDFNDDGVVSAADLAVWSGGVNANRTGDGNADGVSDGQDFLLWQRQLGSSIVTPTSGAVAAAIPEPQAAFLFAGALLALAAAMRPQLARRAKPC